LTTFDAVISLHYLKLGSSVDFIDFIS